MTDLDESRGYGWDKDGLRWVKDPGSKDVLPVEVTPSLRAALDAHYRSECQHPNRQLMRVFVANGAVQVREACPDCGQGFGNAQKQRNADMIAALPKTDEAAAQSYRETRDEALRSLLLDHAREQYSERGRFTNFYREYLRSPEWARRRQLVIRRCDDVCEGCGENSVDHVHHLTYDHLGSEFLFELMGLCSACHRRIENEKEESRKAAT